MNSNSESLVVDSGPLIALARIGLLDTIGKLSLRFVCPDDVCDELDAGHTLGHVRVIAPWLDVLPLASAIDPIQGLALGRGESAVLRLAIERNIRFVCIDEGKARRAAKALGLSVTGTLGLLARAKTSGLIAAVRPQVDALWAAGVYLDVALVDRVLVGVGE